MSEFTNPCHGHEQYIMHVNYFKMLINIIGMGLMFISIYLHIHKQTYNRGRDRIF